MSDETATTRIDEGHAHIGYDPACDKWEILQVGQVHVTDIEDGADGVQMVRYPGWHMRSSTGAQVWTTEDSYVSGSAMSGKLKIGGYTIPELQEIAS